MIIVVIVNIVTKPSVELSNYALKRMKKVDFFYTSGNKRNSKCSLNKGGKPANEIVSSRPARCGSGSRWDTMSRT